MSQPPKRLVRESFERAAVTYDSAAQVQRRICQGLAASLPATIAREVVLDAGCGTGFALPLLQSAFPQATLLALDISPAMLGRVQQSANRLAADVERLPLVNEAVGLYWSSLALQWCDLGAALTEARRVLAPGGQLAIATLGPGTFAELRTAFSTVDSYNHTLAFLEPKEIAALAQAAGFSAADVCQRSEISHYPNLKSLLLAVKAIGANQVGTGRRTGLMSRTAWQRAEIAYETLRQPEGLPLSYDVITIHAQK